MTDENGAERGSRAEQSDVGSVADETLKLLSALQGWANGPGAGQAGTAAHGLRDGLSFVDNHVGHGQDCRFCPVCRLITSVRATSPEVRDHLTSAVGSLADALTAALRQPSDRGSGEADGPTRVDLDD